MSMFAVFIMCSLTLCFPFPFPRGRKRFISIYFFGFFNLILKSLIYCSCIAILKIDFFSLTLFLQLLYQPVSLLPLQPLLGPAARARARYPGPLFPWVPVIHCSNDGRERKSIRAPVGSISLCLCMMHVHFPEGMKLTIFYVCVFSVPGLQFGRSRWSGGSCRDQWGCLNRWPTERLWCTTTGRNICHRNAVSTTTYSIHRAWQLCREVSVHVDPVIQRHVCSIN